MKKIILIAFLLVGMVACKDKGTSKHESIETQEIKFSKDGELIFYDAEDQPIQKIEIEVAESDYEQQTGLMYRKSMKEDRGMLFVYADERPRPYFYMKNTYIALDLIYINANMEVVDFNENAQPMDETTLPSNVPAKYVLEVNAGMVQNWGLKLGDKVNFELN